jgi:hypothetical protein
MNDNSGRIIFPSRSPFQLIVLIPRPHDVIGWHSIKTIQSFDVNMELFINNRQLFSFSFHTMMG